MKVLAAVLIVAFPLIARAQIVYQSQQRDIMTHAGIGTPIQRIDAPDFGIFDQTLSVTGTNPDAQPDSVAYAHSYSELEPSYMVMFGRNGGTDNYGFGGAGEGAGRADLNVAFSLAQAQPFSITATESSNPFPQTLWFVELDSGSNTVFDWESWPYSGINFTASGTLPAGSYNLSVEFYDGAYGQGTGTRYSDYSMTFAVPEPSLLVPCSFLILLAKRKYSRSRF